MKVNVIMICAVAALVCSCSSIRTSSNGKAFPKVSQDGKTAIVAHRGFWNCEEGGYSENSLAALQAAIDAGFWGCELDIHLTADGQVLVNHDGSIGGKEIASHNLADFNDDLLPNGERRPTFDEYLSVAEKSKKTKLVIEFKLYNEKLLSETMRLLRKHGMYSPKRVLFISFSREVCEKLAGQCPAFYNQYLNGGMTPAELATLGINGLDYGFWEFRSHPEWVEAAHALGMSVNSWTVDYEGIMDEMIALGVDAITTNTPLALRNRLGEREFKN